MEKKRKVVQIYAIIICIIAVVTFIICVSILVSSIMARSNPMYSGYSKYDLSSFESYKMEVMKSVAKDQAYIPDDETVMTMYEAAKTEKINRVNHNTLQEMVVSSLLILVSLVLFVSHWMIMKKYNQGAEDATPAPS